MEPTRFKQPNKGFLEGVRQLANEHNCLLIFDEMITGFRMSSGGAQEYYGVTPDLVTFAKAIANGYSLAAVAGRRKIIETQADIQVALNSLNEIGDSNLELLPNFENVFDNPTKVTKKF